MSDECWRTVTVERALYLDDGSEKILCDRLPSPVTLVLLNPIGHDLERYCTAIADQAVPFYRSPPNGRMPFSCTSHTANRWQAAWDGACIALGGNPQDFRR